MAFGLLLIFSQFLIGIAVSTGDFLVVTSPKYMKFVKDANDIETSEIAPMILASFGLALNKDLKWNGLEEMNLFQRPKATVVISVENVAADRLNVGGIAKYRTIENEGSLDTSDISSTIESIDWNATPLTVNFYVDSNEVYVASPRPELFVDVPLTLSSLKDGVFGGNIENWFTISDLASLNVTQTADFAFVAELSVMKQVVKTLVGSKDTVKTHSPDFFHFSISNLAPLAMNYGYNSVQYNDALKLVASAISQVTEGMRELYGDNVVVDVVTFSPEAASKPNRRRVRRDAEPSQLSESPTVRKSSLNLSSGFSSDYSAIFNIILWFSIVFAIVIFYIAWAIWFMDPGRDSIIYRMTSTRMKRD